MGLTERVNAAIDAALGSRIVGCVVLIRRHGQPVFSRAAGFADREAGRPMTENAIFRLASCSKTIVSAAALVMRDRGLLSLDDPVTKYLPWFAPKAPDGSTPPILIRHLLTHTSGITYDSPPPDVSRGADTGPLIPLEENLRRMARGTLVFTPGERWAYGMSIDLLGGVLATIEGSPSDLEAVTARYVTGPLGMADTHFFVTDPARLAVAYGDAVPQPIRAAEPHAVVTAQGNTEYFSPGRIFERDAPQSGGAGMAGTAADFMALLEALRGDLLAPATKAAAFANQIGPLEGEVPGTKFGFFSGWIDDPAVSGWPMRGMLHWGGVWGNNWIIEPESQTTLVVMTNTMREGCNGPFRQEVRDAVFA